MWLLKARVVQKGSSWSRPKRRPQARKLKLEELTEMEPEANVAKAITKAITQVKKLTTGRQEWLLIASIIGSGYS